MFVKICNIINFKNNMDIAYIILNMAASYYCPPPPGWGAVV